MSDTYIGTCKCCEHDTDLINGLCEACFTYTEQVKKETKDKLIKRIPKPYAFGKVQNDGQDFQENDKNNVYLLFYKDEEGLYDLINEKF